MTRWKLKFISFAGKITLIKSTLSSFPIHTLSCLAVPKQTLTRMEGMMRAFLWNQSGQSRTYWVSWAKVTIPIDEGGLGIHKLSDSMYGLHGKLAWNIFTGESLWARILFQKYGLRKSGLTSARNCRNLYITIMWLN